MPRIGSFGAIVTEASGEGTCVALMVDICVQKDGRRPVRNPRLQYIVTQSPIARYTALVTARRHLLDLLSNEPRSVSSLARELGLSRADVEDDLRHMIRSARASGHHILVVPARCRGCGFTFDEDKLTKPSKCPSCRGTRLFEPQIRIE